MREIWVRAKQSPHIMVSNHGGVIDDETGQPPRILMSHGRPVVNCKDEFGNPSLVVLARLVAASFFDCDIEGYEINHIDGDRDNNAVWNLEVMTHEENAEHAYDMGLMIRPVRVMNLDTGQIYESLTEAGRKLGYLTALHLSKEIKESKCEFVRRGYRLKVV